MEYYEEHLSLLPSFCQFFKSKNDRDDDSFLENEDRFENLPLNIGIFAGGEENQIQILVEDFNSDLNEELEHSLSDSISTSNEREYRKSRLKVYWKRYDSFMKSPKVHFFYDAIFYGIFLIIFSYMLLCDFNYAKIIYEEYSYSEENSTLPYQTKIYNTNTSSLLRNRRIKQKIVQDPSFIEYLVIFWVFAFFFEEVNQVIQMIYFFYIHINDYYIFD